MIDLGERILQLMDEPPSHIVMPAIHLKREEVGKLFEEKLHTEKGNSDPTYLTRAARRHLRNEFLTADVAMTGCNFGIDRRNRRHGRLHERRQCRHGRLAT